MPQSIVITSPTVANTSTKKFPKQGLVNLKISRNKEFDTVEVWYKGSAVGASFQLEGATFIGTAVVSAPWIVPTNPTVTNATSFNPTVSAFNYMKIKLDDKVTVAYLRCPYTNTGINTSLCGGTSPNQAIIDWSIKPNILTSGNKMFANYSLKSSISKWDVSKFTDFTEMFMGNGTFNQDLSNWNTVSATAMGGMFSGAVAFNQNISNFDTKSVVGMSQMFNGAMAFNQPIGNWDTSSVTSMSGMFNGASAFNQDISNWNISKVTSMAFMFNLATAFNQDISSWPAKFNVDIELSSFMNARSWSSTNYDKFLNALWLDVNTTRSTLWASRTKAKVLSIGTTKYTSAGATARAGLISKGWTITDGGLSNG